MVIANAFNTIFVNKNFLQLKTKKTSCTTKDKTCF